MVKSIRSWCWLFKVFRKTGFRIKMSSPHYYLSSHSHTGSSASWTSALSTTGVSPPLYGDMTKSAKVKARKHGTEWEEMIILCANGVSYPFSLPPGGGSTRAARGRKGDFGERESWEGDGVGPSVWLSESPLFFSWAWKQDMRRLRMFWWDGNKNSRKRTYVSCQEDFQ